MGLSNSNLTDTRVYAQDTEPNDTRDGVMWVKTSVSPRETYVYSTDSNSWESTQTSDHDQLNNVVSGQHHTKPTQTQTFQEVRGWETKWTGNSITANTSESVSISTRLDAVRIKASNAYDHTVTVNYSDGSSVSKMYSSTITHTFNFAEDDVSSVAVSNDSGNNNSFDLEVHKISVGSHSHGI